jgi:hypothetical protein
MILGGAALGSATLGGTIGARPAVGKNVQLIWNVRAVIGKDRQLIWNVVSLTPPPKFRSDARRKKNLAWSESLTNDIS